MKPVVSEETEGEVVIMATPAEVAERDGVTKQAVTKHVRHLAEHNRLPVERDGRGRIARFSLAHFDHLRGQFSSSARTAAATGKPATPADVASTSREEALRKNEWLKYAREKLRYDEEQGRLVRADRLVEALRIVGRELQTVVNRLANRADDLALTVGREGAHGLRVLLRKIAFEINTEQADKLAALAIDAPETDDAIDTEE